MRGLVFRGHADSKWKLESSLRREYLRLQKVEEYKHNPSLFVSQYFSSAFLEFLENSYANCQESTQKAIDEYFEMRRGFQAADTDAYVDYCKGLFLNGELNGRSRERLDTLNRLRQLEGRLLGLAQHYGMPTPLLDWTRSPYVAWYFSLADESCEDGLPCIYALAVANLESAIDDFTRKNLKEQHDIIKTAYDAIEGIDHLRDPSHWYQYALNCVNMRAILELGRFTHFDGFLRENERLRAQSGLFTNQSLDFSLEDVARIVFDTWNHPFLYKFVLTTQARNDALILLRSMNVHGGTLFPGPSGSARLGRDSVRFDSYSAMLSWGPGVPPPGLA